jgi:hypothetical protein
MSDAYEAPTVTALGTLTDRPRNLLFVAALLCEGVHNILSVTSTLVAQVLPRHPLFYRTNQLTRQVDELAIELRREAAK